MDLSRLLETYTLIEILELNDITEEEALEYLVVQDFVELPAVKPVDLDD